jgi:hypothetical protein
VLNGDRDQRPRTGRKETTHDDDPESAGLFARPGGPLFQLLRRAHLSDDALRMARQRIIVITSLVWLPLLVLSALEGQALGGSAAVPFLRDLEVHIRFLLALPLLIIAELVVHRRMRPLLRQFLGRNLIPEDAMPRFDAAIASAFRLRNSVLAEVLLIAFVYGVGILIVWRQYVTLDAATWYASLSAEGAKLSLAGMWYGYVSLPIFQFLLVRWYFRVFIWTRFLWQVARIELNLVPTHPDRVGGLGFLSDAVHAYAMLAVAQGALLAGPLANRIFFLGAALPQFKAEIAALVIFLLCVVLGPLLVFAPQLTQAKRKGLREYGTLAERYVREFDAKWLRGGAPADEPFVGSGDIQSLADLANSFEVVRTMRIAPITREDILRLVAATLVPLVPPVTHHDAAGRTTENRVRHIVQIGNLHHESASFARRPEDRVGSRNAEVRCDRRAHGRSGRSAQGDGLRDRSGSARRSGPLYRLHSDGCLRIARFVASPQRQLYRHPGDLGRYATRYDGAGRRPGLYLKYMPRRSSACRAL